MRKALMLLVALVTLLSVGCSGAQWKVDGVNLGFCLAKCGLDMGQTASLQLVAGETATVNSTVIPKIPCMVECGATYGLSMIFDAISGDPSTKDIDRQFLIRYVVQ